MNVAWLGLIPAASTLALGLIDAIEVFHHLRSWQWALMWRLAALSLVLGIFGYVWYWLIFFLDAAMLVQVRLGSNLPKAIAVAVFAALSIQSARVEVTTKKLNGRILSPGDKDSPYAMVMRWLLTNVYHGVLKSLPSERLHFVLVHGLSVAYSDTELRQELDTALEAVQDPDKRDRVENALPGILRKQLRSDRVRGLAGLLVQASHDRAQDLAVSRAQVILDQRAF